MATERRRCICEPLTIGRDYGTETEVIAGLQGDETVVVNQEQ